MSNFSDIKRRLSMSTTMPSGTGGGLLMGSAEHSHTHQHNHDGSCCSHDHNHDDEEHAEDCDSDHTNPSGNCC